MVGGIRLKNLALAAFLIPTESLDSWKIERFSSGPQNSVSASSAGLKIAVKKSASPLIYPLPQAKRLSGFRVSGKFQGLPKVSDVSKQGERGHDDFPLRVGFLVPGEKKLSGLARLVAASWVKRLYEQVPEGTGLESVHFYNVTQDSKRLGLRREHPSSTLLKEEYFAVVEKDGDFRYDMSFPQSIDAVGVWISVDGDDTKSEFEVTISELGLLETEK